MLARVSESGGTIAVPKAGSGNDFGLFAHFIDTEGNKVGLHSMNWDRSERRRPIHTHLVLLILTCPKRWL
jgi:hypothetical protein